MDKETKESMEFLEELENILKSNTITIENYQIPSERSRINALFRYANKEIDKIKIKHILEWFPCILKY